MIVSSDNINKVCWSLPVGTTINFTLHDECMAKFQMFLHLIPTTRPDGIKIKQNLVKFEAKPKRQNYVKPNVSFDSRKAITTQCTLSTAFNFIENQALLHAASISHRKIIQCTSHREIVTHSFI
jgi:hypothetical protein